MLRIMAVMLLLAALAPGAGGDDNHTPKVLWKLDLTSDHKGSGAVADIDGDGKPEIVFGTYFNDGHLYAVNAEDGSVCWRHKSDGGPFDASVAIDDLDGDGKLEILAADSGYGTLRCLNGAGRLLWTVKLPSGTDSPPAIADLDGDGVKEIVVGSMWRRIGGKLIGKVSVIRSDTRAFVWHADIPGCVQSEPALCDLDGDGVLDVIVTSWRGDRGVHALSGKTGAALWTKITDGGEKSVGMYHGVSVTGSGKSVRIIVSTCNGDVYALDRSGQEAWTKRVGGYLFAPSSVADLDGDGQPEVVVMAQNITALRVSNGEALWTQPLGGFSGRGAAVCDVDGDGASEVLLSAGRSLRCYAGKTGALRWSFDATIKAGQRYEKISSAPLVADMDGDGKLDVFLVCGKGNYGGKNKGTDNYGVAMVITAGAGRGPGWTTFRGNLRRTGVGAVRAAAAPEKPKRGKVYY